MFARKIATASLGFALAAAGTAPGGCTSTGSEVGTTTVTAASVGPSAEEMRSACAVEVPGTKVTATATDGYAALEFVTSSGDLAELRARVRGMAEMNNRYRGGMRMAADSSGGVVTLPASDAFVEYTPDGARLVFRPRDAAQLQALRRDAPMWATRLSYGQCPSMAPPPAQEESPKAPGDVPVNHDILTPPPFSPAIP